MVIDCSLNGSLGTFLLDTGSDISIWKQNTVDANKIDDSLVYNLTGIGEGAIPTVGSVRATLFVNNIAINHTFHIVNDDFPIPVDGIIGADFIRTFSCLLDFRNFGPSWFVIRPNFTSRNLRVEILNSPKPNTLSLPARSEVIRQIKIESDEDEVFVVNQEISDGVFIANTIVNTKNAFVKIINTTNKNLILDNKPISFESLKCYTVVKIDPIVDSPERKNVILSKLKNNCPVQYREVLHELCSQYTDVFALESDKVSCNNFYKQKLHLNDKTPVFIKNYRTPHSQKEEMQKHINKLLNDDIVEPSNSEYNSPILLVPKKSLPGSEEKRWRLVIDYRQLNKKLVSDKYPLPRIDDILDQLGRAKFFSVLDLISGFHQIELDENSRNITSFSGEQGSFRFKRLPYGLKISPPSFQRMMTMAFSGLGPNRTFIYMDDIIVIGCSEAHMVANLKDVFETCRKTNLKLHPEKCNFFSSEVTFLGHKCTDKGILPDDSKYDKILSYPKPTNADEAKRFVAFVNYYRRFIPNFSFYSIHLTQLTKKNKPFIWTNECDTAFQYLKKALLSPPILKYPDFNRPFCITTDASKIACGAVLSQNYDGVQMPIAYASRSFTKGESHKSVIEQELTAIHWAINYFKPYVFGKKFLVQSDHKPLTYLFTLKNPSSKLTRMRLDLEEFDFEVQYIKGKDNCGADALSRIDFENIKQIGKENKNMYPVTTRSKTKSLQCPEQTNIQPTKLDIKPPNIYETITTRTIMKLPRLKLKNDLCTLTLTNGKKNVLKINIENFIVHNKIALEQLLLRLETEVGNLGFKTIQLKKDDNIFKYISINELKNKGNIVLKKVTIVLTAATIYVHDPEEKIKILNKFHNDPILGGHAGISRLLSKIRRYYTWRNMSKDVREYVKNCESCKRNKVDKKFIEQLVLTPTPTEAFDTVQIDTVGPLPKTNNGNEYLVTIICDLTKFLIAVPIPNKLAKTVAKALVENCILIFGPIKKIISDMGSEYKNEVFAEMCVLLNIVHKTSTPYHHQTVGTVERSHRTLNEYLRTYLSSDKSDWDDWVKFFTYCFNTTPSSTHGYSPFELVYGKTPAIFKFVMSNEVDPLYNVDSYQKEIKYRLQVAQRKAANLLQHAKQKSKNMYDKNANPQNIQVDDMVLLRDDAGHKLDSLYKGPYRVLETDNIGNCKIEVNKKKVIVHKNRLKLV